MALSKVEPIAVTDSISIHISQSHICLLDSVQLLPSVELPLAVSGDNDISEPSCHQEWRSGGFTLTNEARDAVSSRLQRGGEAVP